MARSRVKLDFIAASSVSWASAGGTHSSGTGSAFGFAVRTGAAADGARYSWATARAQPSVALSMVMPRTKVILILVQTLRLGKSSAPTAKKDAIAQAIKRLESS